MKSTLEGSLSSINNDNPSVSKIISDDDVQTIVEKFCYHLTKLEFDSAQQYIENHKLINSNLIHISDKIWHQILITISQLSLSDQGYFSLSFFTAKFFTSKNNHHVLKDQYKKIRNDLNRIDDNADSPFSRREITDKSLRKLIVGYFCNYCITRIDLIEFYTSLINKDWRSVIDESLAKLNSIYDVYKQSYPSTLSIIHNDLILKELELLIKSFNIKKLLLKCQMLDSLLLLKEFKQLLIEFFNQTRSGIINKQNNSSIFSFIKPTKSSFKYYLINWFINLYNALLFKFSLYFNDTLFVYLPNNELKQFQTININYNMHNYISTYMKKQGCNVVSIIMHRNDDNMPFYGFGYYKFLKRFSIDTKRPIKDKFPVLFSLINNNQKCYDFYKLKIDNFLMSCYSIAQSEGKPRYFNEKEKDYEATYICTHIEWQLYLIMVFEKKVAEKDNSVITFLSDVIGFLRFTRLYQELRTPSKSRE